MEKEVKNNKRVRKEKPGRHAAKGTRGRRRKGESAKVFLSVVLLCVLIGIVVFSLSMFFYVRDVAVTGNVRYTTGEILEAAAIGHEENMFKVKTGDIKRSLLENFHYMNSVSVEKIFPSTISITVGETVIECQMRVLDKLYYLDRNLKILEIVERDGNQPLPYIIGIGAGEEALGEYLGGESKVKTQAVADIIGSLKKHDLLDRVNSINVSDEYYIIFMFENRIEVRLGNYSQIEEKIDFFNAIKDRIHESDSGPLDISDPKRATFNSKGLVGEEGT